MTQKDLSKLQLHNDHQWLPAQPYFHKILIHRHCSNVRQHPTWPSCRPATIHQPTGPTRLQRLFQSVWDGSIAEHGPTQCLVENLRPLLHKYNVSGYLSGHDHNLQHISDVYKGSRVEYFLSGAANFIDNSTEHMKSVPAGSLKYHYGDASGVVNGGLCLFKATQSNLTVTYLDSKGLELYQTVIHPRDWSNAMILLMNR